MAATAFGWALLDLLIFAVSLWFGFAFLRGALYLRSWMLGIEAVFLLLMAIPFGLDLWGFAWQSWYSLFVFVPLLLRLLIPGQRNLSKLLTQQHMTVWDLLCFRTPPTDSAE